MSVMLRDLAYDASSPKVRLAVIKGLKTLLKCERSHIYLKQALAKIGNCLHDINEAVRLAVLDLLSEIKLVKSIRYWDICPLDHLLARLEVDKPQLRQKIVRLLMNSFFPGDTDEETKLERCVFLIKENRKASRKFYEQCEKQLDLHDCVKFMLAILVNIKRFVRSQMVAEDQASEEDETLVEPENVLDGSGGSDKENRQNLSARTTSSSGKKRRKLFSTNSSQLLERDEEQSQVEVSQSALTDSTANSTAATTFDTQNNTQTLPPFAESLRDVNVVCGLLDVVCIFWVFRSKEISQTENAEYRSLLEKKASKILSVLFKHYRSTPEVIGSVVYLCSFLPHSAVSTVAGFCLSRIKAFELPAKDSKNRLHPISTYTDALCNWGRGDDLLEIIISWLKKGRICVFARVSAMLNFNVNFRRYRGIQ